MVRAAATNAAQTFCYGAMTMLTVPEEFLLLTLKDEDGGFVDIPLEYQRAGFVGAAITAVVMAPMVTSRSPWLVIWKFQKLWMLFQRL